MAYTVIRTDLMSGTNQPADLVSLRFYDGEDKQAAVENGVIVKLEGYEDGEREVMKAVAASSTDDLNDCAIVAGVKLCTTSASVIWTSTSMRPVRLFVDISPAVATCFL